MELDAEVAAVFVDIDRLKPWSKNPRHIPPAAVDAVAAAIQRFGWGAPILARVADGEVIAGHTRLLAARKLGLSRVPVRFLALDAVNAALLAIADNQLGTLTEFVDADLGAILAELRAEDANLDLTTGTGFATKDVDALIREASSSTGPGGVDPGAGVPPEHPVSQLGELYQLGPHRLLCGDATSVEAVQVLMAGERAVLCATDPPYLVDYDGDNHPQSFERQAAGKNNNKTWYAYKDPAASVDFFAAFIQVALAHALVENPAWYQWHASRRQALVEQAWERNGLLIHQQIIWVKARPILTRSHFMWQHEPAFYGWVQGSMPTKRPPLGGENTTVWTIDQVGESDGIHPTQKPLALFERPIGYHTAVGDLVYEPFCGSGSQIIAAARLGRRCNAIELEPAFVDVIRRRWTGYARSAGIDPGSGALV